MEVLEICFNPKRHKEVLFESFVFKPKNIYEEKLGSLVLTQCLKIFSEKEIEILPKLADLAKKTFFQKTSFGQLKSFKECLKKINEFLHKEIKEGKNILGNLSVAIFSVKNQNLFFSKFGEIEIFLQRENKIFDIGKQKEKKQKIFNFFSQIFSGKIKNGDCLLILSTEVADFFKKEKIISQIEKIQPLTEKELKKIFSLKKEKLKDLRGGFLLIKFEKEKKAPKKFQSQNYSFSFAEIDQFFILEKIKQYKILLLFLIFCVVTILCFFLF